MRQKVLRDKIEVKPYTLLSGKKGEKQALPVSARQVYIA